MDLIPAGIVEGYYRSAFQRASILASPEIIKEAAQSTQGFPYQIQLVGYYLSRFSTDGRPVERETLRRVTELVLEDIDEKVFRAMLQPLSDRDRGFLAAMAACDGVIKTADIESITGFGHGTLQTYRSRLIDAGIITSPRRGELAFAFPQLADYLRRLAGAS